MQARGGPWGSRRGSRSGLGGSRGGLRCSRGGQGDGEVSVAALRQPAELLGFPWPGRPLRQGDPMQEPLVFHGLRRTRTEGKHGETPKEIQQRKPSEL
eukprot:gene11173-biopygen2957